MPYRINKSERAETCSVADEIEFDNLPESIRTVAERVIRARIQIELEDEYDRGYQHGLDDAREEDWRLTNYLKDQ